MRSGVYKITNEVNGKFYIGSSKDIDDRWENGHKGYLNRNQHVNPKLQNAWNYYGSDKFTMILIEIVEPKKELLLEREQYYLDLFKPYYRSIGYNICPKAVGGDNITHNPNREIFLEKMSEICSGEGNPMFGRKHADKSIKLQKEKAKGRYTIEWFKNKYGNENGEIEFHKRNQKLKDRKINYSYDNKLKGKKRGPMSQEIKDKISNGKAKLKIIRNDLHRDILSNNFTLIQLENKYGISKPTILKEKKLIKYDTK
jgi:group I intron endonuclease